MKKSVVICSLLAGALLLVVSPSPTLATCAGGLVQPIQHSFGGFFDHCPDAAPVRAYVYVLGNATSINSASVDIACEDSSVTTPQQSPCQAESGQPGDGNVTINFNWGGGGTFPGCPNANQDFGVGRNIVQLVANDGSSVMVSVGFSRELGFQYALDCAAQQDAFGAVAPMSCTRGATQDIRIVTNDGQQLCVNIPAPKIFSDCDSGSMCGPEPNPFGVTSTCGTLPNATPGRLFRRDAPCTTPPSTEIALGWVAIGAASPTGDLCVPLPRPTDPNQCTYVAGSGIVDGQETLAALGTPVKVAGQNAPSARALDVRASADGARVVVSWRTDSELDLAGFNVVADTKGKGRITVTDALIAPRGVNGSGARYDNVSVPRGKFQGARTLYVEAVLNSGAKILSDPVKF